MAELEAAYQKIESLTKTLRAVRGELETTALYETIADDEILVDCLGLIDEALADRVVA